MDPNEEKEKVKSGYEETSEQDTFQDLTEEKIHLPGQSEEHQDAGPTGPAEHHDDAGPSGPARETGAKTDIQKELKERIAKQGQELEKENDEEINLGIEKKEIKKEKGEEEDFEEVKTDVFEDIDKLEAELEKETEVQEKTKEVNWQEVAKEVFDEDLKIEVKENSITSFKSAVKDAIEAAKTKTVIDLSKYNEEQKDVITFFENGGSYKDFLDPLKQITDLIIADDEQKVKDYLVHVEDIPEKEVQTKIDELIEEDKFDKKVEEIDKQLYALRERKFQEIIKKSNETVSTRKTSEIAQREQERTELISAIKEMKSFMDIPLTDKVRDYLVKEVESGRFDKAISNARTKVEARLFALTGNRILQKIKEDVKDTSRSSYNKGVLKEKEKLHNLPPERKTSGVEEQKKREPQTDPLFAFTQIEKDTIDTD